MNISAFDVYLISILDSVSSISFAAAIMSTIITCILFIAVFFLILDDAKYNNDIICIFKGLAKKFLIASLASSLIYTFMPGTKTAAAMYVVPAIANSELVSKDIPEAGKELINLATEWMKSTAAGIKENNNQ